MALHEWPAIHALDIIARIDTVNLDSLESVKKQFPELFQGLGKLQGEYEISLKPDAKPFSLSTPRRISITPHVKSETGIGTHGESRSDYQSRTTD